MDNIQTRNICTKLCCYYGETTVFYLIVIHNVWGDAGYKRMTSIVLWDPLDKTHENISL
jgi:hypothetical protein